MRKHLLVLAMMGMSVVGCSTMHAQARDKGEEDEGNEQKIAFAQVPEAAQKTLTDEAKGNKIGTVDKEMKDGKTVYEADSVINGRNYEIVVSEDGTLISKKLDDESKEKGEKNEQGENEKGDKD